MSNIGWECPKCQVVYSPDIPACPCSPGPLTMQYTDAYIARFFGKIKEHTTEFYGGPRGGGMGDGRKKETDSE